MFEDTSVFSLAHFTRGLCATATCPERLMSSTPIEEMKEAEAVLEVNN